MLVQNKDVDGPHLTLAGARMGLVSCDQFGSLEIIVGIVTSAATAGSRVGSCAQLYADDVSPVR